jgi:antitoxin (DNA-binding transcriptional repressor) of toxin-antitoxin stability system
MATITARKLSRETSSVIDRIVETGDPMLVIRGGHPVAALVPVDAERVEDVALATAPRFAASLARADEAAEAGETSTLDEIFAAEPASGETVKLQASGGHPMSDAQDELAEPLSELATAYARRLAEKTSMSLEGEPAEGRDAMADERARKVTGLLTVFLSYVLRESVASGLARAYGVNDSLIEASRRSGSPRLDSYAELLDQVTAVERAAGGSAQDVGDLPGGWRRLRRRAWAEWSTDQTPAVDYDAGGEAGG